MPDIQLSIVSPVYRGASLVAPLVSRITEAVSYITESFEIILVDDGSPDDSWEAIRAACQANPKVRGIQLSRNFGQQMAVSAGLRYAKGVVTVIMDADLQNPPEMIPSLYREIEAGYDIVYTTSTRRNHWRDELSSKLFWWVLIRVLKVNIIPNQLMLKAFSRRFLAHYNSYDERVRVVAGITHDIGLKHTVLEVENQRRTQGKGNYSFFKRFHLMLDIILAMTNKPLEYLINISLFAVMLSVAVGSWNLASYLLYPDVPPGYTTLLVFVSFFGSLNLLILGIMGRYLSNIYIEVRHRPVFLVQQSINIHDE